MRLRGGRCAPPRRNKIADHQGTNPPRRHRRFLRQHKSAVTTAVIMTSPITTTTLTYRAASEFSTKPRAAVPFGAFRFSAPPPPPETAGYVYDSPRAGEHSTQTARRSWHERDLAIFLCVRMRDPGRNRESRTTRLTQRRVHENQLDMYRWLSPPAHQDGGRISRIKETQAGIYETPHITASLSI